MFCRPPLLSIGIHVVTRPFARVTSKSAFSTQPQRAANILGSLHNFRNSYGRVIRRGRGPSSGKGKTSGRGHKGQGQHGGVPEGMNGGQTPDHIVAGPYGFKNWNPTKLSPLNVGRLQDWISAGRIDPTAPITFKELVGSRCIHGIKEGVKLLSKGSRDFKARINITVSRASRSAIAAIEARGGKVTTRFFNREGVLQTTYPQHFPVKHRLANPTSRKDLEYYRNPDNRGYLTGIIKPDYNPRSLFFKHPKEALKARQRKKTQVKTQEARDRLW